MADVLLLQVAIAASRLPPELANLILCFLRSKQRKTLRHHGVHVTRALEAHRRGISQLTHSNPVPASRLSFWFAASRRSSKTPVFPVDGIFAGTSTTLLSTWLLMSTTRSFSEPDANCSRQMIFQANPICIGSWGQGRGRRRLA